MPAPPPGGQLTARGAHPSVTIDHMDIITEADQHLAEQRQRHKLYLWALDQEHELLGYPPTASPWRLAADPVVDEPDIEAERFIRNLADEHLSDEARDLLEQYVLYIQAQRYARPVREDDAVARVIWSAAGDIADDALRTRRDPTVKQIQTSARLMRYADYFRPAQ